MEERIKIATCQFPISNNIRKNSEYIKSFIKKAVKNGANLIHFSETALSGYAGVDFDSFDGFDWNLLKQETDAIIYLAKGLRIWTILGTSHFHPSTRKITNCIYVISNHGEIVTRYDKRMLTKNDIKHYEAGIKDNFVIIEINNVKFGVLICYDSNFPEMFKHYKKHNVNVILHSLYNARNTKKSFIDEITPAIIRARAVDHEMWIIANNSSAMYSNWPTCICAPDGTMRQKLSRHKPGILYHEFPDNDYKKWRVKYL